MSSFIPQETDQTLIQSSLNGDQAAFGRLVSRYEHKVGATVVGMLGNTSEADDIAQETFIRFFKSMGKFRGESQLGTYLTRIAINLCLTHLNRRKRWKWLSLNQAGEGSPELEIPDYDLDPGQKETQQAVQLALQKLEPDFRSVIVLRMIEGYSTKETAEMLNLPQGTVLSRLARGQKKLKGIMEQMGLALHPSNSKI